MQAEISHLRHRDQVDAELERQHGQDLVAVDRLAALVDGQHAIAVAVERDPEVEPLACNKLLQGAQVGGAATDVDVGAVRAVADRDHLGAEPLERRRRDARVGAVGAVDPDPEALELLSEALDHMVDVTAVDDVEVVDPPLVRVPGSFAEQRLDLLLRVVRQLLPVAVEELDAVVLRRIVGGRDDRAEIECEQGDGRRREHAREHGIPAGRGDAGREGALELAARAARVAADQDGPAAAPERHGPSQPLDESGRQVAPNHSADSIRTEVPALSGCA